MVASVKDTFHIKSLRKCFHFWTRVTWVTLRDCIMYWPSCAETQESGRLWTFPKSFRLQGWFICTSWHHFVMLLLDIAFPSNSVLFFLTVQFDKQLFVYYPRTSIPHSSLSQPPHAAFWICFFNIPNPWVLSYGKKV